MTDTLPLSAKGKFAPPPILDLFAQRVSAAIQTWPDIISATHWHLYRADDVDGADFYVAEDELGHIHLNGEVHLATSLELRKLLLAKNLAKPFPYYASWVQTRIGTAAEAEHALWLFKLNYDRIKGETETRLSERIEAYGFGQ